MPAVTGPQESALELPDEGGARPQSQDVTREETAKLIPLNEAREWKVDVDGNPVERK